MKRVCQKTITMLLVSFMCLSVCRTCYAAEKDEGENTNFTVYSPQFPEAYIVTEESAQNGDFAGNSQTDLGSITATVFVEEKYSYVNGQRVVTDSKLLSKDEVEAIGEENFGTLKSSAGSANSRGKLKITFSGTHSYVGKGVSCNLKGNASWSGFSTVYDSSKNPAVGKDFFGVAWAGGFSASNSTCTATWNLGGSQNVYLSEAVPNAGRVYEFDEFANAAGKYMIYVKDVNLSTTLSKNVLNGGGNTAEAVLKYIHTYQTKTGSISISASASGVGAGFSLSNTSKQWNISCVVNGIPY